MAHDELTLIIDLPDSSSITDVSLQKFCGEALDVAGFKRLFDRATPILPKPDDWHYSPWYRGSFVCNNATFHFDLYLGGRGLLRCPDGRRGLFEFKMPRG